jgi:hypothetical protein
MPDKLIIAECTALVVCIFKGTISQKGQHAYNEVLISACYSL